jgi:DNA repair protein RecO (recombination protein O)
MYRKYHTEGFILESLNFGEANKLFLIFTKDLGLLKATAKSVRESRSKLRYGLTNYSISSLSVIRSKKGWRITGATSFFNVYFTLRNSQQKVLFLKLFTLLKRLMPEEEPSPLLFDNILESYQYLLNNNLDEQQSKNLECLMVLKLLKSLGYLGSKGRWQSLIETPGLNPVALRAFTPFREKAVRHINQSLKESQLM